MLGSRTSGLSKSASRSIVVLSSAPHSVRNSASYSCPSRPSNLPSSSRRPSPTIPMASISSNHAVAAAAVSSETKPSVGILGIGLMGNKMAQRLVSLGFPVTVWNRTHEKAAPLAQQGCKVAKTADEAVEASEVVLTMLSDAQAIEEVLLGSVRGKLGGKTVVQMGTIGPNQVKKIASLVESSGASFLEAPVLGSQPEALAGTLLVMVGCNGDMQASKAFPVLQAFGKKISFMGEVGTAAASKLALNQLISSLTIGFSTSLAMIKKNDVDLDTWMGIVRESALYAPTYDKKLDKYNSRNYGAANFPTKHLLKDVRLFAEEAEKAGCETGFIHAMENICEAAVERGYSESDYSAVYDVILEPVKAGESVTPEA